MKLDLHTRSEVAEISVFDPAAVAGAAGSMDPRLGVPDEVYNKLVDLGAVLTSVNRMDGNPRIRVRIDEPSDPDEMVDAENRVEGRLLRVPSGILFVAGREYVSTIREVAQGYELDKDSWAKPIRVAPGNYRAAAFEMDWGEEAEEEFERATRPLDRLLQNVAATSVGCGCCSVFLVLPLVFFAAYQWGRWEGVWTAAPWAAAVIAVSIFFASVPEWFGSSRRFAEARDKIDPQYPAAVIVLERLPDGADLQGMKGGRFGIGVDEAG